MRFGASGVVEEIQVAVMHVCCSWSGVLVAAGHSQHVGIERLLGNSFSHLFFFSLSLSVSLAL